MKPSLFQRLAFLALSARARLGLGPPVLNLFHPRFRRDPYPSYRLLRERDPVHRLPRGGWVVTRYADAEYVLTDPRFIHGQEEAPPGAGEAAARLRSHQVLTQNPPAHTRLRAALAPLFAPSTFEALRDRMQALAAELLDRSEARRRIDLVTEFARPLPLAIITDLLGLPPEDVPRLSEWTESTLGTIDPFRRERYRERGEAAARAFTEYFFERIEERRRSPGEDWISRLAVAQGEPVLSDEEIVSNCVLLFLAGHETTVGLIGAGALCFLRNPDQAALLRDDPSLMPQAVQECLRFEAPLQLMGRMVAQDLELGERRLRQGEIVWVALGAANRDPAQFAAPDTFDITRHPNRHLSFGAGVHQCLGHYLARVQGEVALAAFLRRFPEARQAGRAAFDGALITRGLSSLPVAW